MIVGRILFFERSNDSKYYPFIKIVSIPFIFRSFSANFKCLIVLFDFNAYPINSPPAVVITLSYNLRVSIFLLERIN